MAQGFRYYQDCDLEEMARRFREDYLSKTGWTRSADLKEAVDLQGPVPWMTYPAIEMLRKTCRPVMKVFEFGSGGSTLWWSERVASVIAVEHDPEWAAEVSARLPPNARVESRPPGVPAPAAIEAYLSKAERNAGGAAQNGRPDRDFAGYLATLLEHPAGTFDIIVVDGAARNTAGVIAADMVTAEGLVVIDNSDRDYGAAYEALAAADFARIDFWGPGPINPYGWCTSIFTRSLAPFRP